MAKRRRWKTALYRGCHDMTRSVALKVVDSHGMPGLFPVTAATIWAAWHRLSGQSSARLPRLAGYEMLMSCDWRHRLGLTVSGASEPSLIKPNFFGSQTGRPSWVLTISSDRGAMKP